MNKKELVHKFHEIYDCHIGAEPGFPKQEIRDLRIGLLREEWEEYLEAEEQNDYVEVCDALGDMLYIIYGTCVSYGIPINEIFQEIHNSNLSKLDEQGKPIRREDGKILKGPNFFQPNIPKIIEDTKNNS
jgi:predicted HAD superfamily Cof-like phosphohydrolase